MRPAPEDGIIHHGRNAHAGHQIAPAVAGVAQAVQNHPDDQQRQQQKDHVGDQGGRALCHVTAGLRLIAAVERVVIVAGGGNVIFLDGDAVPVGQIAGDGVECVPDAAVVIFGHETGLQITVEKVVDGIALAGAEAAAPAHIVVAAGLPVIIVVQRQQDENAVVALAGPDAQPLKFLLGVRGDIRVSGRGDDLHGDLRAGLGEQGGVDGVDMLAGSGGEDLLRIVDIGIAADDAGGGRLARVGGLAGLADGNGPCNGQHQNDGGNAALLEEFHSTLPQLRVDAARTAPPSKRTRPPALRGHGGQSALTVSCAAP